VIHWPVLSWLLENLVWASAAMLLVLAIRRPVARYFGAGVAYGLWLVPALRLVAPPADWIAQFFNTPLPSLPPLLLLAEAGGEAAPPPLGGPGQWVPILLAVWAGGAFLFLIFQAFSYRRFLARLSRSMRNAGSHAGLPLIESGAVDGPLAVGLLDRRIVVPAGFEQRYTPAERRLALDHERYHHRRGDILANHFALVVLALNWFNPVAWIAFRAFRSDQELSCDAAIAAEATPDARCDYARALVKSASRPGLIAACPLNRADQLKRRLKMLNHHRKDRRRLWAGTAVTASLIATSLLFGTAGQAQPTQGADKEPNRERIVIMDLKEGEAPPGGLPREFRIRRGDNGEIIAPENCIGGSEAIANVTEGTDKDRSRILLCGPGGGEMTAAKRLEALQRARARIAEREERGVDHRTKVLETLDREIARLRAQ
jgi:beta-lactamase regulating signal transducer with metallopeptidase domain